MIRRYIDCRDYPSINHCTVTIAADSEEELLDVAVLHGVKAHGHEDTPQFRDELRKSMRTGAPPA